MCLGLAIPLGGCSDVLDLPDRQQVPNLECIDGECVCVADYADCDGIGASGCETELRTDSSHCGKCGHDCLGGECLGGVCQPVVMTSGLSFGDLSPPVALQDGSFYVLAEQGVVRVSIDSIEEPFDVVVGSERSPRDFAVNASNVAWIEAMRVCSAADGLELDCDESVQLPNGIPVAVAFARNDLYFVGQGIGPGGPPLICRQTSMSVPACRKIPAPALTARLRTIDSGLYWLGAEPTAPDGPRVFQVDLDLDDVVESKQTGTALSLYGHSPLHPLAVVRESVVESRIVELSVDDLEPLDELTDVRLLSGYAFDGQTTAYVTLGGTMGIAGDEAPIVARDTSYAGMVADETAYYFVDIVGGSLIRIRAPAPTEQ